MPETLYVLTQSAAVVNRFRRASLPGRKIKRDTCLAEVGCDVAGARVIIDPRALESCCVAAVQISGRPGVKPNVSFLDLLMLSRGEHEVHGSVPPCVEFDDKGATVSPAPGRASTRAAWLWREHLFAQTPAEPRQARFLALARRHRHEAYREVDAAADLLLSVRQLTRLSIRWFGCSPRVVIGLFRVESVGRGLRLTMRSLKDLARVYGYCSRQAMNRHFHSFAGVHPATYRAIQDPREIVEVDSRMSEYGPFRDLSNRGIYAVEGTPIGSRPIGVGHYTSSAVASIPATRLCRTETTLD